MKKLLKLLLALIVVLVLIVAALFAYGQWRFSQATAKRYPIADPKLTLVRDAATIERGRHQFNVLACVECHGKDGSGQIAIDAGPVGVIVAPNLTPGALPASYDADGIAAAIRHGLRADGTPLLVMPSEDFAHLSDEDTAALVTYIQSMPRSTNDPGKSALKPLGYILFGLGKLPLLPAEHIDHSPRERATPVVAVTAEYGEYLARACTGCHARDYAGQHVPGTPPEFPDAANLTPHADGLKDWTQDDFVRAIREGKRPDGRELNRFMPWPVMKQMSDTELAAIWTYLRTLPPVADKKKS
ncbi:c-type cytochrome [Arenimonas sp.]|uniref:c-type cytochrome n=1 Tax=Arenimonas sp. TaxID=1872635 RepID=UPI0039E525E5